MQGYPALRGAHGSVIFSPCILEPDDLVRLRSQAAETATSVHLLKVDDLSHLVADAACPVADRGRKHAAKPLASYFAGKTGLLRISTDYCNPGQAERGVRALLSSPQLLPQGGAFFIGLNETLFKQLWHRTSGTPPAVQPGAGQTGVSSISDDFQAFIDGHPNLVIPAPLKDAFRGSSLAADRVRRMIALVAKVDYPVLIEGETGTGKEIIARQIHNLSSRCVQPFLPVNCGGIPAELLESELFGHRKGAFTGALTNKDGLWTLASAGTLFLDEIGDLSKQHQVKILRALEDGKYRAVGGTAEIASNARVIAATNRDLAAMVAAGRFREDLYYRLFTFRIRAPSLRDHPDDIPELSEHFWRSISGGTGAPLPAAVLNALKTCRWPGNARELRAFLINVYTLADGRKVTLPMIRAVLAERLGPLSLARPELDR